MNLGQKIKALRESKGLTQQDLAELSGVSISSIKKFEADINNNMTLGVLSKIAKALNVDSSYFLGENPISKALSAIKEPMQKINEAMKLNINFYQKEQEQKYIQSTTNPDVYHVRKITSVKASAGGGNELEGIKVYKTGEVMPISKAFFKAPPGKEVCSMEIEGESMLPVLKPGDWVIFSEDGIFKGDGLYVVNFSNQLMVKILQITPQGTLKIISANKEFQGYEINLDETQETCMLVGKVLKSIV